MSRPKNVYLSKRAMVALRHTDSLSGRINQIIDRYLALITPCEERVRAAFSPEEWACLQTAYKALGLWQAAEGIWQITDTLSDALGDTAAAKHVAELDLVESIVLVELLERHIAAASAPPATQSQVSAS